MLLSLKNLMVTVPQADQEKVLVNQVNLDVPECRIVALVGGSGSGKTTTGLSILRLLPFGLDIKGGSIHFDGKDLLSLDEDHMRAVRGKDISMVFQEPLYAFNPVFTIAYQIDEVLQFHTDLNREKRQDRILELLDIVGIDDPRRVAQNFPHQLSGGMRQRAMIAQAIAANPKLVIADEPTSNLDVTLQARIIELFHRLKSELNLSILLITHDLGMVQHLSDDVAVMTKGSIVETGATKEILSHPQHDYTHELLKSLRME